MSGYVEMCERSRELEARAQSLEETFPHNVSGDIDLRWLMVHMVEETARHAGHVDIFRELIDGGTGT